MPQQTSETRTFQALEQEAYYAFIEWPLFLIRKLKQLQAHIAAAAENLTEGK